MFSKIATRVSQTQQLTQMSSMAFRASVACNASKKPSIGDAVTILQSKVSGISQVVSQQQPTILPHRFVESISATPTKQ